MSGTDPAPIIAQEISFHPEFNDLDADVILRCDDGPRFKIQSHLLKRTSSHFDVVLSIPQPNSSSYGGSNVQREPILLHMPEPNQSIEILLRLISSLPIPPILFQDLEIFSSTVHSASKYGMLGALSVLRAAALVSSDLQAHPLQLYKLACQNDWSDLTQKISMLCLAFDPMSEHVLAELQSLSVAEYGALAKLALLRCERFAAALRDPKRFTASGARVCVACGRIINEYAWLHLRYRLSEELRRCPAGNTIRKEFDSWSWPESTEFMDAAHCATSGKIYGWENTKKGILMVLEDLPSALS